jgi:hypothetical protein
MSNTKPILLALLCLFLLPPVAAAAAQGEPQADGRGEMRLFAFTFEYQRALEALPLIEPLLSPRGSIELQRGGNTLVVRDTPAALARVIPVLHGFDHPPRTVGITVRIVQADRAQFSPIVQEEPLPEPLLSRLKKLLPFSSYRVLARTDLHTREGESVVYELGDGYRVAFRLAPLLDTRKVKLESFRVSQAGRPLLHSTLSLPLARPTALGLASAESSESALMVVLTPGLEGETR